MARQTILKQNKLARHPVTIAPPDTLLDAPELVLTCSPVEVLNIIRTDNGAILSTKLLAIFYALADAIEKTIEGLKNKCRPLIISRRNEGTPIGAENQHREFLYQIPAGEVRLTVQERMSQQIDQEKLEALLKAKGLLQSASSIDMDKVSTLRDTGLITAEDFAAVSGPPQPKYALIARVTPKEQAGA